MAVRRHFTILWPDSKTIKTLSTLLLLLLLTQYLPIMFGEDGNDKNVQLACFIDSFYGRGKDSPGGQMRTTSVQFVETLENNYNVIKSNGYTYRRRKNRQSRTLAQIPLTTYDNHIGLRVNSANRSRIRQQSTLLTRVLK